MATEQAQSATQAEAKPKEEKQANCLSCNKPIRKIRRYYRDGKFYCTKKCWSNFIQKAKSEEK